ncbi:MAG: hypothetical protein DI537_38340 [Stutzerimonas stutzeri]|nr:MAG: hypothetical protein DI537_38340 [Stutzerimonas stutzeri]
MTAPKALKPQPRTGSTKKSDHVVEDLETQRRLRRDLNLANEDIAGIDMDLAIEAGLLSKPKRRQT